MPSNHSPSQRTDLGSEARGCQLRAGSTIRGTLSWNRAPITNEASSRPVWKYHRARQVAGRRSRADLRFGPVVRIERAAIRDYHRRLHEPEVSTHGGIAG